MLIDSSIDPGEERESAQPSPAKPTGGEGRESSSYKVARNTTASGKPYVQGAGGHPVTSRTQYPISS